MVKHPSLMFSMVSLLFYFIRFMQVYRFMWLYLYNSPVIPLIREKKDQIDYILESVDPSAKCILS